MIYYIHVFYYSFFTISTLHCNIISTYNREERVLLSIESPDRCSFTCQSKVQQHFKKMSSIFGQSTPTKDFKQIMQVLSVNHKSSRQHFIIFDKIFIFFEKPSHLIICKDEQTLSCVQTKKAFKYSFWELVHRDFLENFKVVHC